MGCWLYFRVCGEGVRSCGQGSNDGSVLLCVSRALGNLRVASFIASLKPRGQMLPPFLRKPHT